MHTEMTLMMAQARSRECTHCRKRTKEEIMTNGAMIFYYIRRCPAIWIFLPYSYEKYAKFQGKHINKCDLEIIQISAMNGTETRQRTLTGLLIQKMSALSARVSSGPKSVMGWASTRELCFLFSMLGLAVLYREWI